MGYLIFHQITLPEQQDSDAFEAFMRDEYLPAVNMGPTRVGEVTGLTLLRGVSGTHERTHTFLMQVSFDGLAHGDAWVDDEEVQRKFESFDPRDERLGVAHVEVAVWPEDAPA
jgi:hypothetical protein